MKILEKMIIAAAK